MKIKTRILWISCIAVLAASVIGDTIIWELARKSSQNEAFIKAYQNSYEIISDIEQMCESMSYRLEEDYLRYYLKSLGEDYNICIRISDENRQQEEIYNHTILDTKSLLNRKYESMEALDSIEYAYMDREEGHFLIFCKQFQSDLMFFRLEDISYVWEKMEWLTTCMFGITLGITALVCLGVSLALRKVLKPLQELTVTTKYMAEGKYSQRVKIQQRDEVGQLGESFNRMAEAVEARTRSLEESEKKKTLFMGDLTHELKTPMTAISGYAQTLLSTKLSASQQEEALLYIYEECKRLERLSHKMMKLLELDQEGELELTNTKVSRVFEVVRKSCTILLQKKQMILEIVEHGEQFLMDVDLMTDALINITDNAIKASEMGGRIILRAVANGIEVQDFGRGIPIEEQEKILEPFYMVDKSRSRKSGGAGLGLALTALIAKRHNIALRIESEEGKGTCVILQFV